MKKWIIFSGIVVVIILTGYFVLSFTTVKFMQPYLQKALGPGFTLNEIKANLTYLSARGVQYEDPDLKQRFLRIEEVRFYPHLFSLLKRSLHIKKLAILQPSFFFFRSQDGEFIGPWVVMRRGREGKEVSEREEKKKEEPIPIRIDRIRIQKGSIDFEDRKMGEPPVHIRLGELHFEMKGVKYPFVSSHSPIELKGKIKGRKQEGHIYIKGWIDLKAAGLEAFLKIREIEVETFKPYYRKRVTAEIDSGTMDMESRIVVGEERIEAHGEVGFINLHIQGRGGTVFWIPAETLAPLLEKNHRIKVPFHMKGNLGDPQFSLHETFLARIAFSLAEAMGLPIKSVRESGFGEPGEGEKGLRLIEELFKKKKEKKR